MSPQLFIIAFCILWMFMCWRMWLLLSPRHPWQRHAIAVAAGLGAGFFYLLCNLLWAAVKPQPERVQQISGEEIRVSPKTPKQP